MPQTTNRAQGSDYQTLSVFLAEAAHWPCVPRAAGAPVRISRPGLLMQRAVNVGRGEPDDQSFDLSPAAEQADIAAFTAGIGACRRFKSGIVTKAGDQRIGLGNGGAIDIGQRRGIGRKRHERAIAAGYWQNRAWDW
jgi:hypothetical protein